MNRSTLQPQILRALQSGYCYTRQFNPVKKFKKFFSVSLVILLFISPVFAEEALLFPPQLGILVDSYRFSETQIFRQNAKPLIVHIQDAHDSLAVQKNIAALIEHLVRQYGFQAVYEEGNTGVVKTSGAFWMPEKIRLKLAAQFLKEGKITGAEFAHITGHRTFKLYGAEAPSLYEKNLESRQEILFYKPVVEGYLRKLEKKMRQEASRIFPEDLRRYLKRSESFWKGSGNTPFELKASAGKTPDELWTEIKERDRAGREALASSIIQKEWLEKLELISVLKRVAGLEATREDLEYYLKHQAQTLSLFEGSMILQELFRQVDCFYDLARKRDMALIQRTLDGMAAYHQDRIILISGGFHSRGMADLLKKQGVAYAVIAPISVPAAAHTLREPDLFNLPHSEARLLADLRAMEMVRGKESAVYHLLKRDAARLWNRAEMARHEEEKSTLPTVATKRRAVILLPLDRLDSGGVLERVFPWISSLARANDADFVLLARRHADARLIRQYLARQVEEESVWRRVKVARLLTPGDFGAIERQLHGRFVLLVGDRAQKKRLEFVGLKADQFLSYHLDMSSGSRGRLYDELHRLQISHRAFVTSA